MSQPLILNRRQFVTGLASSTALGLMGASASRAHVNPFGGSEINQHQLQLDIGYKTVNFTGQNKTAFAVNDSIPSPVLRWREGERVTVNVKNNLAVDTSIHWHGLILPTEMDGVPGLSFAGIKPGEVFQYQFNLQQSGTYWYHSHSGFQEQQGMYGAIIIEPREKLPYTYDREHVVMLSDWSDEDPLSVYAKLKKNPHFYNIDERTLSDLATDTRKFGVANALQRRAMWNHMRMSDTDLSDVTGRTYTFLMNGQTPASGWVGEFQRGERVLLRFVNAAAMTFFDVRIPGVKMTVVAADGQAIQPVTVDEFRMGVAETYDVIVEPSAEQPYTLFCQAIDRSGFARGTLTPDPNWAPEIPEMDDSPVLTHSDMGMLHGATEHAHHTMSDHGACTPKHAEMGHCEMEQAPTCTPEHAEMGHCEMSDSEADKYGTGMAGFGSAKAPDYGLIKMGPHIDMLADGAQYRLDDPGVGLRGNGRKVLTYADLISLVPTRDTRQPKREIELHLTGNMSRYMWSINGIKYKDAEPIHLRYGERVRINFINNTMMNHPMHMHGMWSELETGDADYIPRKHTVIVQPGAKLSYLVTADALGRWAFHCHLLYHMPSMFREIRVTKSGEQA